MCRSLGTVKKADDGIDADVPATEKSMERKEPKSLPRLAAIWLERWVDAGSVIS